MDAIWRHLVEAYDHALAARNWGKPRFGAELKFPLVNGDGTAARLETVRALWEYLTERGWQPVRDAVSDQVVGARRRGEQNDTVASCETGYCKPEFALAHVADLFDLEASIGELRKELRPFAERHGVHFLGYGIQPVTSPSKRLLMKKTRTSVWDKVFGANRRLPEGDGDDVCLFTVNAASHVHVSVLLSQAIPAVNVLNAFAGAQIALTADSSVWGGRVDPEYKCVSEKLWDWWMPEPGRVGVPAKPFRNLSDYVRTIGSFRPVYVKRGGRPVVLSRYKTFVEYFHDARPTGIDHQGREVPLVPEPADINLHHTCYWFNARLTQHFTVENRTNDQQPPEDLLCIAALTAGLISGLKEAMEVVGAYDWDDLRAARETACRFGLASGNGGVDLAGLAGEMLDVAGRGLRKRALGEEKFLAPLRRRLAERRCPADDAAELFGSGGVHALVEARAI